MSNYEQYALAFKHHYDELLISCDALEQEGLWPTEELGEMDMYFANDISCVLVKLIAADGKFDELEVSFMNEALGFHYTPGELEEVYEECWERLPDLFTETVPESIRTLYDLNPSLADTYREMLKALCKFVTACDGEVRFSEKVLINELMDVLK